MLRTHESDTSKAPTSKAPWQLDAEARIRQYVANDKTKEEEKRRGDSDFIKVYPRGWEILRRLIDSYPPAAKVYAFLAQHIDAGAGAVVASQALMSENLEMSERTIRRIIKYLEDNNALIKIRLQGNLYAYALNPEQVWKSWKDHKDYAAFNTRTLARNKDNTDINRRINLMLKGRDMPLLDGLETEEEGQ